MNAKTRAGGGQRRPYRAIGLVIVAAVAAACVTPPRPSGGGADGRDAGAEVFGPAQQLAGGAYTGDPALLAYVRRVGRAVWRVSDRPDLPYTLVILDTSVPFTLALPGGKLGISRGLLLELQSEAELAGVLAHELVHVAARPLGDAPDPGAALPAAGMGVGLAPATRLAAQALVADGQEAVARASRAYGPEDEARADRHAMAYLSRAGYDVAAYARLLQRLTEPAAGPAPGARGGWWTAHPPTAARAAACRAGAALYAAGGIAGDAGYTNALAGLRQFQTADDLLVAGWAALRRGDAAAATAAAARARACDPRAARAHLLAAKAAARRARWTDAAAALDRAAAEDGRYFDVWLTRAEVANVQGQRAQAQAAAARSLNLLPTAAAHVLLGALAVEAGDPARAAAHFRAAARSPTDDGQKARVQLARLELETAPERHLQVTYGLDSRGQLEMAVANRSPVDVGTCVLGVATGMPPAWVSLPVPGGVPAYREKRVPTGLGPFTDVVAARTNVAWRFEHVRPAGAGRQPPDGGQPARK